MSRLTPIASSLLILLAASALHAQSSHSQLMEEFGAAFNAHDAAKMASMVTDDFQLFYVDKAGKSTLSTTGPKALEREMKGYFQGIPTVKSVMDQRNEVGMFVSFRETATWTNRAGSERSQASLAVYQIAGNKIQRAWYYPAQ